MDNEIKKRGRPPKEKDYNSPFAVRLRELSSGMTQQEIADGVGVSRQNIGQFLLGNNQPDIITLGKLADYFNVSTDYLLCRTDVKTADTTVQDICGYTGLDERAVTLLHESNNCAEQDILPILNFLFSTLDIRIFGNDPSFSLSSTNCILLEKIVSYFNTALNNEFRYFYIQKDGHIFADTDDIPDKSEWNRQITDTVVSCQELIDKVMLDEIVTELKKAKKEYRAEHGIPTGFKIDYSVLDELDRKD